jgi:hypothetical protein
LSVPPHYHAGRISRTAAFQRNFSLDVFPSLGLPGEPLRVDGVEFYGQISFLKTAIRTIQSEPRSPSSHPKAAAHGDELGRL